MAANGMSFGYDLVANCQISTQMGSKIWHGLTPIGQQESAPHCIITYQTH
jgi:hypothetical protein